MRRLPSWVLCMSLAFAIVTPVSHANAQADASFTLGIGDRYRGPDLGFYDEPNVVAVPNRAGVYYVRDSSRDVYRYNNMWYMNYNGDWYRANSYNGPWVFVGYRSVPRAVYTVPTGYRRGWRDYRDVHYDWGRSDRYSDNYSDRSVPRDVYTVPSRQGRTWRDYRDRHYASRDNGRVRYGSVRGGFMLRFGDGYRGPNLGFYDMPHLVRIPGRGVYYVQDSDYDVYRNGNYWYLNYNGDWYRSSSYRGPWIFVGYRSVPRDVYTVPTRYRRHWSDYRDQHYDWGASSYGDNTYYGGTNTGASFTLQIGDRYNGPDLGIYSEPRVVSVPGTRGVNYVRDSDQDVYRYGNNWYMNYNGDWYRAGSYNGPWLFVGYRSVPRDVYRVPTSYRRTWTDYRDRHYDWDDYNRQ